MTVPKGSRPKSGARPKIGSSHDRTGTGSTPKPKRSGAGAPARTKGPLARDPRPGPAKTRATGVTTTKKSPRPATSRTSTTKKSATTPALKGRDRRALRTQPATTRANLRPALPTEGAKQLALAIASAALDKKALNVQILDVVGRVDYADYMVLMSGRSDRHVLSVADGIEEQLVAQTPKRKPFAVEGRPEGNWIVLDFGDVVAHVFQEETRTFYDLDSLWEDARRVPVQTAPIVREAERHWES